MFTRVYAMSVSGYLPEYDPNENQAWYPDTPDTTLPKTPLDGSCQGSSRVPDPPVRPGNFRNLTGRVGVGSGIFQILTDRVRSWVFRPGPT